MKNKENLYTFSANVYASKYGPQFGTTVNTTVSAKNEKEAKEKAKLSFIKYVDRLSINHNNKFEFNNLNLGSYGIYFW